MNKIIAVLALLLSIPAVAQLSSGLPSPLPQKQCGVNSQVGTSYTVVALDACRIVTFSNASPVAVSMSQATVTGFTNGVVFPAFCNQGVGTVTITPTTSTINGNASLGLVQNACAQIWSNGVNYTAWVTGTGGGGGTGTVTHTTGALTSNSLILGNGGGDIKIDSVATSDGAGNLTIKSATGSGSGQAWFAMPVGTTPTVTLGAFYTGIAAPLSGTPSCLVQMPSTNPTTGQVLQTTSGCVTVGTVSEATSTWVTPGGGGGAVSSVSGDGNIITNSGSVGAVTLTIAGTSGGIPFFSSNSAWQSSGALSANGVVLGGGAGTAPKTVAGITTDGTSALDLGVAGTSVGKVVFSNATSGTITLSPATGALGAVTATLPANTGTLAELNLAQSWTATQTLSGLTLSGITGSTQCLHVNSSGVVSGTGSDCGSGGGGSAFSALTSGTNATAAMVVGTGASLSASGSGTISATAVGGITVSGTPSTGQSLVATSSSAADWQSTGVVASGTLGQFAWFSLTGTTVSGNPHLDDGATTSSVITSTENIAAPAYSTTGTTQGIDIFGVGTGAISTAGFPSNWVGIVGPPSGTSSYALQLSATSPAGQVPQFATPSTVNGISQSVLTWVTLGSLATAGYPSAGIVKSTGSAFTTAASSDVIALWTGTCNSGTFLRGDGACASGGGGDTITSPNSTLTVGGTSSATTLDVANAVTFNNAGSGAASGTTYNGSTARTISYNTLGAAPTASPTFTGTITTPLTTAGLVTTTSGGVLGSETNATVAQGGTGATTAANALINLFPAATRVGDMIYCATFSSGCTSWALLAGNNSGTSALQENSSGVPSWVAVTSGGTVTSVTIAGTANQITASGTCTITTSGTCTLSLPNAVILGTDNSAAGTLQLADGTSNAHTIIGSAATTTNTVNFFATAPTTGDLVDCTTSSTTCTLTDSGVLAANVVTAASTLTSSDIVTGNGSKTVAVTALQISSATISNSTSTSATVYSGGVDASANSAEGGTTIRGGDETGAGGASSKGGPVLVRGGNNAATNASSLGGPVQLQAGASTGSTQGIQGIIFSQASMAKGTTVTQWNLQCGQSTSKQTQDCGSSPGNVIGVAEQVNTNQVYVTYSGETFVNASAAVTIGHTVCAGTTAGQVTDSGGTGACSNGQSFGIVEATSGAYTLPDTTSVTATTTLPLVLITSVNPSIALLGAASGGTGINTSASTGVAQVSSGTWSVSTALANATTATTQSAGDSSADVATDSFVSTAISNAIAGVNPAVAVLAASTSSQTGTYSNGAGGIGATFTITATGAFSLDGVSISTIGQRVLLKNQSSAFQNGVYTATVVGTTGVSAVFTRALDYDTTSDINSTGAIPVQSGTVNATTSWLLTSTVNTVGTDSLTYVQFSISPTTIVTSAASLSSNQAVNGSGGQGEATGFSDTVGTATSGHLACYTSSNTIGNCTGTPANNFVGVFNSSTTWISSGEVSVTLDATVNVTFGDILCASSSAGLSHDNGTTSCANGEWVGIVKTTASSVSSATAFIKMQ